MHYAVGAGSKEQKRSQRNRWPLLTRYRQAIILEEVHLLLNLTLPRINELMTTAVVRTLHAEVGAALTLGAKLLDLSIDLSAAMPHDCPPLSLYRIAMRDRVWLRKLAVAPGDDIEVGALVALFSTEADETLEAEPARAARVTIAGILDESDWWLEDAR